MKDEKYIQVLWDLLEEIDAQIELDEVISPEFADKVHKALWESGK